MSNLKFLSLVFFLQFFLSFAQELPPIVNYNPTNYGAGNQNWMITQDAKHFVFFANNDGLLEYNGATWTLYPSPNESIIRSVKVIGNRIYTGSYMEFGFWTRQANGQLKYESLSKNINSKIKIDEQFWSIINYDQWIIFQSFSSIYIFDSKTKSFNIISSKNNISKIFKTNNSIYFQTNSDGLLEIENGKSKKVCNDSVLLKNIIVNIFAIDDGLLIQTQNNGFYKLINGVLSKFSTNFDMQLLSNSIYCSQKLSDGGFAFGTVSNGIFIVTNDWKLKYHITQNIGLSNNTALSLYEDIDKNLWVGLDNGINCINLKSPVKSYTDTTGMLGTVYASLLHDGKLYIGTNQGLFYKNYNSDEAFSFIAGTKGQVWSLFEYENTVFCGHNLGSFILENGIVRKIFDQSGTWKFETIPNHKNLLIQGNYFGFSILEKINDQWVFRNKISGFDYSSKFFEINKNLEVYVCHEYKGILRLQLDSNLKTANNVFAYNSPKKGKNACLAKFNNSIYYAYKEGIFKLDEKSKQFLKDPILSKVFDNNEYKSGKLMVDKSNKLWLFSKNYINYFSLSKLGTNLKQNAIPISATLTNSLLGYENINQLSNSVYLIGTTDGYYTLNICDLSFKNHSVSISNIAVNKINENIEYFPISANGDFSYNQNNITFSYTVPEYNKYINAEYQYLLKDVQDQWSEWSAKSTVNFKNLAPGTYVFKIKAKIANSAPENTVEYKFTISKPWYETFFALFCYLILFLIGVNYIHKAYKKYYQKQQDKLIDENNLLLEIKELESEQLLMKVKNEQLSQDVDNKSRELAVSTMSLIKKDELLALIKQDLKATSDDGIKNIKTVISNITNNISTNSSWNVFKEAFDNADKDFLKKVKLAHPTLTPNDLRLCAYLRLNLSSKEVAPLINISVRSVEIKRYRLRKKMDLLHEQGLVEYILSI